MKTVLYVGVFELPDKNAAAHRVVSNGKILRELGYNVVFLDADTELKTNLEKREDCFGFERWSVKKSNDVLFSIDSVLRVMNEHKEDLGLVIAYNYPAVALNKLRKACRKRNIKIAADVTEWYGAQGNNIVKKIVKGLDSFYRMRIVQPKLDGIIAISRFLEDYYKDKTNTVFIPPLTDKEEEKWNTQVSVFDDEKIHIYYAGTGGKHKDKLSILIRSLFENDLNRVCFHIAGLTKEKYLSMYPGDKAVVEKAGNSIIFKGRISHTEVIKELKSCDFSMFYREVTRVTTAGFSTKFVESITAGVPVLTNHTGDLEYYLKPGENGFWIDKAEQDLKSIVNMPIGEIKSVKKKVDKEVFDYRRYVEDTYEFMRKINII